MTRVIVVSDTHFSADNPKADHNWDAAIRHIEAAAPDLVLHGGDITAHGCDVEAELDHARAQLDRLPVPWMVVPGNHDVGEPEIDRAITVERQTRYEKVFGPRFWSVDVGAGTDPTDPVDPTGGWRLVGLDSQAMVSGHPDDEPWWSWMATELDTDRSTLVVLHRPLGPTTPDESDVPRRYLAEPHRSRFCQLLADLGTVRVVITGHTHQWRSEVVDGIHRIWAPSTWSLISDTSQPAIGRKVLGLVEIDLAGPAGDASHQLGHTATLIEPEGMVRNVHGGRPPPVASSPGVIQRSPEAVVQ